MMRGVAPVLEKHHKVQIARRRGAAAVRLSHRYIPARQLPDKAVSVLDTACARVADRARRRSRPSSRIAAADRDALTAERDAAGARGSGSVTGRDGRALAELSDGAKQEHAAGRRAGDSAGQRGRKELAQRVGSSRLRDGRSAQAAGATPATRTRREALRPAAKLQLEPTLQGDEPLILPSVDEQRGRRGDRGLDRHPRRQDGHERDRDGAEPRRDARASASSARTMRWR